MNRATQILFEGSVRRPNRQGLESLVACDLFFRMPAFAGVAANVFTRDGRIEFNHRLATFDRRVRTSGNNYARLEKTVPGVGAFQTFHAEAARREVQIADRV